MVDVLCSIYYFFSYISSAKLNKEAVDFADLMKSHFTKPNRFNVQITFAVLKLLTLRVD